MPQLAYDIGPPNEPGHDNALQVNTKHVTNIADLHARVLTEEGRATDAQLRDRATHTGTQDAGTVTGLPEAVQDIVGAALVGGAGASITYNDAAGTITVAATGTTDPEVVRDTVAAALVGSGLVSVTANDAADTITVSTTATLNSTDAQLRDRATHTGTQAFSTISDGTEAVQDVVGALVTGAGGAYNDAAGTITLPGAGAGLQSLEALAGAGAVTATASDVFAMRAIGAASATDMLDRAAGDARYAAIGSGPSATTLTDAATIAVNAAAATVFRVTLAGNRTLGFPTNLAGGASFQIFIRQDATGSRTLAYAAGWKFSGGVPALSVAASSLDVLSAVYDGTDLVASLSKAFA